MELIGQIVTITAVIIGTAFSLLGILGFIRMPDVYTRLHATGKVGVFGVVFLLIASAIWIPQGFGKAILLAFFLLLTGPVTSHALASAGYRLGIPLNPDFRNDLEQRNRQTKPE